jgi:hypothetical protein
MSNFVAVVVSISWSKLASKSVAALASGSSGLSSLVPGVVSPDLPAAYARPAAYGDLLTATLALLAIVALRTKLSNPSPLPQAGRCSRRLRCHSSKDKAAVVNL